MLRWLYPTTCVLCHEASDAAVCPDCRAKIPRIPRPICLYCGAPVAGDTEDPYHCPECKGKVRSFRFARSVLEQCDTSMMLVHALKYHSCRYLAEPLAAVIAELWGNTPQLQAHRDWALVPVPVSRKRLFGLGYNHAEELALALGRQLGLRVIDALERRTTSARSQTSLSATARMKNAFAAYHPKTAYTKGGKPLPPHLLVVDDVYTTGATTRACAKALHSLPGVEEVGAVTLVRIN